MSTLTTLIMMYVGYRLFGLWGFVLGPFGYLIGSQVYKTCRDEIYMDNP